MDTIRGKIYALHSELSEALFSATRAEEKSTSKSALAKELEVKQRDLMKAIANKENDLDKTMDALEKATKSIHEKEVLTVQAAEDKRTLTAEIEMKEQELRRYKDRLDGTAAAMTNITSR